MIGSADTFTNLNDQERCVASRTLKNRKLDTLLIASQKSGIFNVQLTECFEISNVRNTLHLKDQSHSQLVPSVPLKF